jgi:deaminated glutathione amidase
LSDNFDETVQYRCIVGGHTPVVEDNKLTRVAALQFASGTDVAENLATCLRMIDEAGELHPQVMVMPEFSNHISWYDDADHAWRVSVELDGEFLSAIAQRALQHRCYIVINVSLRRPDSFLTISSVMFDPAGKRCAIADKQTLMGHENTWFKRAERVSDVVETPGGRLAMFPCRDGVTCETPRALALQGAQLFCDSLNSFALDEATLHVPARAPENRAFLVAANKVGPLIPAPLLEAVSEQTHIPLRFLNGAGESQIVSPSGEILARGPHEGEAVVWADVNLAIADDKLRPDGTDMFASRRPELYQPLVSPPAGQVCEGGAAQIQVACVAPVQSGPQALEELPQLLAALPAETVLAVLPQLFCHEAGNLADQAALGARALAMIAQACHNRPTLHVCTSVVLAAEEGAAHTVVLVGENGVLAQQAQLHSSERHSWSATGDELLTVDLPWGKLAMLSSDDASYPELVKVAALRGVHLLAVPADFQESWEPRYGLPSRAAENRICVVACTAADANHTGLIADLERDFTIMTEWQERAFDGLINQPLITPQQAAAGTTVASLHPVAASNKLMSEQTDLLLDRPWFLSDALVVSGE